MNHRPEDLLQQDWSGDCYRAAICWITAVEETDWVVVHGTVQNDKDGNRIEHAWCERGELVVDLARPIGAKVCEREQYYRVVKPEVVKTYSLDDALFLSVKNGHHGTWCESEQLRN